MAIRDYTRVGTDVRKIARLLQAKAPEGHMLAYITPEEAEFLKKRGGSGKPHEDTGIPSFEEEPLMEQPGVGGYAAAPAFDEFAGGLPTTEFAAVTPEMGVTPQVPAAEPRAAVGGMEGFAPQPATPAVPYVPTSADVAARFGPEGYGPAVSPAEMTAAAAGAEKPLLSDEAMKKLGLSALSGIPGALMARRAAAQGGQAKAEMQRMATPYQQMGQQLQAAATRGELTPASQQAMQAAQARLAQGIEARGGVGAAQAATQLEAFRQQLLQGQADYGLRLSQIGDQVALGAIRTGLQADQYVNQLTSSYFNNIARVLGGYAPQQATQTTPTGP